MASRFLDVRRRADRLAEDFMDCRNLFAPLLVAGLVGVGCSGSIAWGQTEQLECAPMSIVVNVG